MLNYWELCKFSNKMKKHKNVIYFRILEFNKQIMLLITSQSNMIIKLIHIFTNCANKFEI